MNDLMKRPLVVAGALLSTGLMVWSQTMVAPGAGAVPANQPQPPQSMIAVPGTVNYIEGRADISGRPLSSGVQARETRIEAGQVLSTEPGGKAEVLLMPGVVLRIGDSSAVRMVSPIEANTQVELLRGTAIVEVGLTPKTDRLVVMDHGASVVLNKKGLYSFNADQPNVAVYEGKAEVQMGNRSTDVSKGKQLALMPAMKLKATDFDRKTETSLYDWSMMRSQQMAQMVGYGEPAVYGYAPYWAGWYWSPYYDSWLWGPWGYGLGFGLYGGGWYGGFHGVYHGPVVSGFAAGGFHGGFAGGGFHGGGFGGRR